MKEEWNATTFGDIMSPAKTERCGDRTGLPILSITMRSGIVFQSERFKKVIASANTKDYKIVKNGQLVIAFPIDEGLIYTQDIVDEGIMSPAYIIWNVDYSEHNRRFLVYYFHSPFSMNYYKSKLRNTTLRRRMLSKEDLLAFPIPTPPLSEQQRIVEELDLLSSIIEKKKEQLKELDNLAQSIFYDMFGDPVTNEKGWEVKKLGDEFEVSSGGTPSTGRNEFWDNGNISWIGSNMCQNQIIYENDGKYITKEGLEHSSAKLYTKGFVLIALVGATIGKVALLGFETATNQNIAGVNVPSNIEYKPIFVFYLIQSLYCFFENIGDGKFKMANLSFVRSLPIIKPPLSLQQQFASKIEAIEQQKEFIRQSIKEVETLFNSKMDYYFT